MWIPARVFERARQMGWGLYSDAAEAGVAGTWVVGCWAEVVWASVVEGDFASCLGVDVASAAPAASAGEPSHFASAASEGVTCPAESHAASELAPDAGSEEGWEEVDGLAGYVASQAASPPAADRAAEVVVPVVSLVPKPSEPSATVPFETPPRTAADTFCTTRQADLEWNGLGRKSCFVRQRDPMPPYSWQLGIRLPSSPQHTVKTNRSDDLPQPASIGSVSPVEAYTREATAETLPYSVLDLDPAVAAESAEAAAATGSDSTEASTEAQIGESGGGNSQIWDPGDSVQPGTGKHLRLLDSRAA